RAGAGASDAASADARSPRGGAATGRARGSPHERRSRGDGARGESDGGWAPAAVPERGRTTAGACAGDYGPADEHHVRSALRGASERLRPRGQPDPEPRYPASAGTRGAPATGAARAQYRDAG